MPFAALLLFFLVPDIWLRLPCSSKLSGYQNVSTMALEQAEHELFFFMLERGIFMAKKESEFQSKLIGKLHYLFPGCIVLKNDPTYIQGIPDLTVLWKDRWALLECKRDSKARKRPNQEFYIDRLNKLSFARFVCPENEEEVLHDLQQTFGA